MRPGNRGRSPRYGTGPGVAPGWWAIGVDLEELNSSGVTGSATVTAVEQRPSASLDRGSGMTPNSPHAQLLDGSPTARTFTDVVTSLTTEGDTTLDSMLAVDRFPVADAEGNLLYERTISAADLPGRRARELARSARRPARGGLRRKRYVRR